MFLFIIASCTSVFVVRVVSGFVRVAPVLVWSVVPGMVTVVRESLMDLSRARLISLHLSFPFFL